MDWYELNIEEPIREIVRNLRNNGINTFCSCGHGMWIQCESVDQNTELNTIYCVFSELKIKKYRVQIFDDIIEGHRYTHIEISFPDKNGEYYSRTIDNESFILNKF
jgi:hypothetical protein